MKFLKRIPLTIWVVLFCATIAFAAAGVGLSTWTALTTFADGDLIAMTDVSDTTDSDDGTSVSSTWLNFKANCKTYFDTIYYGQGATDTLISAKEDSLGNPGTNDYVLASQTDGTRSWVAPGGSGTPEGTAVLSTGVTEGYVLQADGDNSSSWVALGAGHTQGTDTALGTLGTKSLPIDADKMVYRDSTAADALVTMTFTEAKAFLKTYNDTLYNPLNTVTAWNAIGDATAPGTVDLGVHAQLIQLGTAGSLKIGTSLVYFEFVEIAGVQTLRMIDNGTASNISINLPADSINDLMIDWGTGENQISAVSIPIADALTIITATDVEAALQENRTAINLNTAKETNATHSGDVTGDTALTIQANSVDAAMISDIYAYQEIPVAWMVDGTSAPAALDSTTRKPYDYRAFDTTADEDLNFVWVVPADLSGTTIQYRVYYLVTAATGPSSEGVAFGLSGASIGDNDATNGAKGTVVVVTDTGTAAQHDVLVTGWSGDVTITDLLAGEIAELAFIRDVDDAVDDYAQDVGVTMIQIRYVQNPTR
jgi:hypothetical protein